MEDFSLINDGHRLDGTIFQPTATQERSPAILFVHGWTSERARSFQYAEGLTTAGYICVLFDMRGHGSSQGDRNAATSKDFLRDVVAAYDYVAAMPNVDAENISVVGSSFGCYLITLLTKERSVKRLVLRAPADYPNNMFEIPRGSRDVIDFDMPQWRTKKRGSGETYALEALHNFTGDTLIIESEFDEKIPHQVIENYISAVRDKSKVTHELLRGAPHSIKEAKFRDKITNILVQWFSNTH